MPLQEIIEWSCTNWIITLSSINMQYLLENKIFHIKLHLLAFEGT